jgi:hypothetical protein
MTASSVLDVLEELITSVADSAAADVDAARTIPRAAVAASSERGLSGSRSQVWLRRTS